MYVQILLIFLFVSSISCILIPANGRENIGIICDNSDKLWRSKIDGKNQTFNLIIESCYDDRGSQILSTGDIYIGIISCNNPYPTCLYIHNTNNFATDIRYAVIDITPPYNAYLPLFYVCLVLLVCIPIIASAVFFGLGLYVGKKAKSKTEVKVIPGDQALMTHFINMADNVEPVTEFSSSAVM